MKPNYQLSWEVLNFGLRFMNESISAYQIAHPVTLYFAKQLDKEYGGVLKFHHVCHSYLEYHNHDFYEFFICTQGKYEQVINGKKYTFSKLGSCLIYPEESHGVVEKEPDSWHYSVTFEKNFFERTLNFFVPNFLDRSKGIDQRTFILSEARLKKVVLYLTQIKEIEDKSQEQKSMISFLLFNLVESLFNQTELSEENKRPEWLKELLIEINKPENLHWDVTDTVAHTNYSKTHLCRLFKEHMGISLGEYLQKVKISNARDLLVNSDMSLSELCDIIGHSSLSHFSSVFKKTYGMAPGKYRAKFKATE